MTKADLLDTLSDRLGFTRMEADKYVDGFVDEPAPPLIQSQWSPTGPFFRRP